MVRPTVMHMHTIVVSIGEWSQLNCSGRRPPPSSRFTFNKIDPMRALLFGGKQDKYTVTYNHIFILDMENMVSSCILADISISSTEMDRSTFP